MIHDIYLAGGCFWGTEQLLRHIGGVVSTEVGYANSSVPHPSYEEVCSGSTGAAEAVHVVYDDSMLPLSDLLQLYFESIDPTSLNRQGSDHGTQYRTGIYFTDPALLPTIRAEMAQLQSRYRDAVQIEVGPLQSYYPAEEYHQGYLLKHPTGYCHVPQALIEKARQYQSTK